MNEPLGGTSRALTGRAGRDFWNNERQPKKQENRRPQQRNTAASSSSRPTTGHVRRGVTPHPLHSRRTIRNSFSGPEKRTPPTAVQTRVACKCELIGGRQNTYRCLKQPPLWSARLRFGNRSSHEAEAPGRPSSPRISRSESMDCFDSFMEEFLRRRRTLQKTTTSFQDQPLRYLT